MLSTRLWRRQGRYDPSGRAIGVRPLVHLSTPGAYVSRFVAVRARRATFWPVALRIGSITVGTDTAFHPDRPLLLLHIYKTSGSSIRLRIERTFDVRRIQGVYHTDDVRSRLKGYVTEENVTRTGAELYYGHFYYGLHQQLSVPAVYGTFLRDPIERAVSHYRHFERFSSAPERTLSTYLDDGELQLDNLMTRMVSGYRAVPFGEVARTHLDHAKRNLESFAFIGFVETLSESMDSLGGILGAPMVPAKSINVNEQPAAVSDDEKGRLAALNAHDQELYRFAQDLVAGR